MVTTSNDEMGEAAPPMSHVVCSSMRGFRRHCCHFQIKGIASQTCILQIIDKSKKMVCLLILIVGAILVFRNKGYITIHGADQPRIPILAHMDYRGFAWYCRTHGFQGPKFLDSKHIN